MKVEEQKEWLDRWYMYMRNQQLDNAKTRKEKIEARLYDFTVPVHKKFYKLLLIRYYLLFLDLEKAAQMIAETGPVEDNKYHWLNYYYYFFRGFYHLESHEYKTAVDYFTRAKLFISDIDIEETAELYYKLASGYYFTFQISRSIKYTNKALKIFKDRSNFKRLADCENLLGVSNKFIDQYKESLNHYQNALTYVEISNNKVLKVRILHNLGNLYSELNISHKALYYLNEAYANLPLNDVYLKCKNLYLLAKNNFNMNRTDQAMQYLNLGLNLSLKNNYIDYHHHFSLLQSKFINQEKFQTLSKEAINYFYVNENLDYIIEYSEDLATHLREIGNHKEAMYYFHLAVETKNRIKKERVITSA